MTNEQGLNWHGILTDETGTRYPDVGVRVSGATVSIRSRSGVELRARTDVEAVIGDTAVRTILFADGAQWRIDRKRGGG